MNANTCYRSYLLPKEYMHRIKDILCSVNCIFAERGLCYTQTSNAFCAFQLSDRNIGNRNIRKKRTTRLGSRITLDLNRNDGGQTGKVLFGYTEKCTMVWKG